MTDLATTDFDPNNRAWQRLQTIGAEQLDLLTWRRDDGRPVFLSLIDLFSGDTVTFAVIDSHEVHDPHALLALAPDPDTTDPIVTVHGPFDAAAAAHDHEPRLVAGNPTIAGTCPAPLHHPSAGALPDSAWVDMPPDLAATVTVEPASDNAAPVAVLLLDRRTGRHALIGPFPHRHAAQAWQPADAAEPAVQRHVVALRPAPPADLPTWLQP